MKIMYYMIKDNLDMYRNYILSDKDKMINNEMYYQAFDGKSHKVGYKPLNFVMAQASEKKRPIADVWVTVVPVCSQKAKDIISSICDEFEVEFLPCNLEGTNEQYYVFNVLGAEDCVDYNNSKFLRYPSSEKIMFFEHIEFNKEIKKHFFRINDIKYSHYFVNEETKEILEKAGLKGVFFDNSLFVK